MVVFAVLMSSRILALAKVTPIEQDKQPSLRMASPDAVQMHGAFISQIEKGKIVAYQLYFRYFNCLQNYLLFLKA